MPLAGRDVLNGIPGQGGQLLLAQAIEAEVAEWIEPHSGHRDERYRQQVVRNGACGLLTRRWCCWRGAR